MKKVMMIAAIAAALVSCQSKGTQNNDSAVGEGVLTVAGNDSSAVAVYEGLLPAADGPRHLLLCVGKRLYRNIS